MSTLPQHRHQADLIKKEQQRIRRAAQQHPPQSTISHSGSTTLRPIGVSPQANASGSEPTAQSLDGLSKAPQLSEIAKRYSKLPRSSRIGLSIGLLGISLLGIYLTDPSEVELPKPSTPTVSTIVKKDQFIESLEAELEAVEPRLSK